MPGREMHRSSFKDLCMLCLLGWKTLSALAEVLKHLTQRARALETLGLDVLAANRMLGERAKDGNLV